MALCGRCRHRLLRKMNYFWRFIGVSSTSELQSPDSRRNGEFKGSTQNLDSFDWIKMHTPCFMVSGKQIDIIHNPTEYFHTLKTEAYAAKKRIVISSLYLGTGNLEQELVNSIHNNLKEKLNSSSEIPRVKVLLDYTRGFRGQHNSVTMLLPILKDFNNHLQISLYHTPNLRGFWKKVMPQRYNEIIGVQHMKVYMFDDNLLISGANMSDSYFTNRQDRYIMFRKCPDLCDFFERLVTTVSSLSFSVKLDGTVALPTEQSIHPYEASDGGESYKMAARQRILSVLKPDEKTPVAPTSSNKDLDTVIYPLIQMGLFNISVDDTVTQTFLRSAPQNSKIYLASGYFNLTEHYKELIVNDAKADFDILMASPQVNGFYNARGPPGGIPHAYTNIAKHFFQSVCDKHQDDRIRMYEYYRDQWTFHAKGLWYYPPGAKLPAATFIGSPNFGYRSLVRDLEAQLVVVTENTELQEKLHHEHARLYQRSEEVSSTTYEKLDRYVPLWVRMVTTFFKNFF